MMKKYLFAISTLTSFYLNAQNGSVGINTESPKATLHVLGNPSDTSKLDGIIAPIITGDELAAKTYGTDQTGAILYVTASATNKTGQVSNVAYQDYYYFNGTKWLPLHEPLYDVVNRGNYSPKYISFSGNATTKLGTLDGAIGFNPTTYSYYFGNMNQNHTGYYNIALGYDSMPKLTNSHYNVSVGSYAGSELTTGQSNSFFGSAAGYKLTTGGWNVLLGEIAGQAITTGNYNTIVGGEGLYSNVGYKNTSLGYAAGYWDNTGNLGTYIGYKTASGNRFGNNNLMLGNYAGGKNVSVGGVGTMGDNNLFIGTGAGYNDTGLSNKLIIHSNGSLSGFSNTAEGNFTTNAGNFNNALITGDFSERWVKINGSFQSTDSNYDVNFSSDGYLSMESGTSSTLITPNQIYINQSLGNNRKYINLSNELNRIDIGCPPLGPGLVGFNYYGNNYENNSFVQKKYVDDKMPTPPATGTYILKSINGVIQWVAE